MTTDANELDRLGDQTCRALWGRDELGTGIFDDIAAERDRQDERWGEQNHPLYAPDALPGWDDRQAYLARADLHKQINEDRVKAGTLSWDGILLEEVYEALSEKDPYKRRAELVQVAAVVAAMIECEDRRRGK